jgi:tetratricopeptide (TPR) repeat protein
MSPKPPIPPLSTALAVLRTIQRRPQTEIADAIGCGPTLICDYEAARKPLSRERLDEIAVALGIPVEAVDLTLSFLKSFRSLTSPEGGATIRSRRAEAVVTQVTASAEVFARSLLALGPERRAEEDRRQARVLWDRLKSQPPDQRRELVESTPELRSWALCELVCERSLEAAADKADRALDLAGLAVRIAELAPGEAAWRQRLQGYALAHFANARRVSGDLPAADKEFARARLLWQAGASADPGFLQEALFLGLDASLRREQRRLPEALALLDKALSVAGGGLRSQLLVNKANFLELANDFEGAIDTLQAITASTVNEEDPRLSWLIRFTLANNLLQATRTEEAEELLPELRKLAAQLSNELDSLRLYWLEGRIAAGLGRREKAIACLNRVRESFATRRIAYDTALASLEITALLLEEGRTGEVRSLARQMLWVFQAQGVHREALGALRLFCQAAERETVTAEMVRELVAYFYQARYDPSLRFEDGNSLLEKKRPLTRGTKGERSAGRPRR